jgi:antitoxin VapB
MRLKGKSRVYIQDYIYIEVFSMPHISRVFQSGNSQAVRLPKEFRFSVDRVEITQEGDALILRPHTEPAGKWKSLTAALARGVSDDFFSNGREQPEPQDRSELDELFQ